jgi:DNA-nicking Smr family endonuclease
MSRRRPTPEELELFNRVLADARRPDEKRPRKRRVIPALEELVEPPAPKPEPKRGATGIKTGKKKQPQPPAPPPPAPKPRIEPAALGEHAHGLAPGVDRRLQVRLKRGQVPIEGRMDLHGMGRDQAQDVLNGFLARSEAMGHRCVLVITGKGRPDWQKPREPFGEGREIGVIRRLLPGWLRDGANAGRVLAFSVAQPKDGGAGAWYVLLRRRRDLS